MIEKKKKTKTDADKFLLVLKKLPFSPSFAAADLNAGVDDGNGWGLVCGAVAEPLLFLCLNFSRRIESLFAGSEFDASSFSGVLVELEAEE